MSTAMRVTTKTRVNYDKSGKHTRNLRGAPQGTEEEGGDDDEILQGMDELTADDYACI